jgi:RNA polymerase primary sigma factor
MPAQVISSDGQCVVGIAVANQSGQAPQMHAPVTPPATAISSTPAPQRTDDKVTAGHGTINESNPDDDDDMENWLSVAAIEAELKPKVIEIFDTVAGAYKRLRRLQDQDIQFQLKGCRSLRRRSAGIRR